MKFQRRFANNFSFLNSYTFGKAIDLNSDNDGPVTLTNVYDPQYNRGPADYDITHTFSSSWVYELPWAREKALRRLAVRRHPATARRAAADRHADAGRPVHGHWKSSEPHVRRQAVEPDHRQVVRSSLLHARRPRTPRTYGDAGRNIIRGPGSFNIDASLIKNTKIRPLRDRVPPRGVQRAQPSAVREPEHDDRQRRRGSHLGDALEPVLLGVRHGRAERAARE